MQRALELYTELKRSEPDLEVVVIPISGGTTHKPPPLDSAGFPITEAQVGIVDILIFSLLKLSTDMLKVTFEQKLNLQLQLLLGEEL